MLAFSSSQKELENLESALKEFTTIADLMEMGDIS
jgi:hypothetical protein